MSGEAGYIIGTIMSYFRLALASLDTVVFGQYTWLDICITFFALDIFFGFIFYLIGHGYTDDIDNLGGYSPHEIGKRHSASGYTKKYWKSFKGRGKW